jgi:hypothetical protein
MAKNLVKPVKSTKRRLPLRATYEIRGVMPARLVEEAKLKSGISSDSNLLEVALASLARLDEYAEWLFSRRGSIAAELDLEF